MRYISTVFAYDLTNNQQFTDILYETVASAFPLFENCHHRQREIDLLAEYIWPAMCSFDQRLPDVFVDSWETFPVNMPAAAGLL